MHWCPGNLFIKIKNTRNEFLPLFDYSVNKILSASPALVIVTNWSVVHQIACDQGGMADTCYGYLEGQNKILKDRHKNTLQCIGLIMTGKCPALATSACSWCRSPHPLCPAGLFLLIMKIYSGQHHSPHSTIPWQLCIQFSRNWWYLGAVTGLFVPTQTPALRALLSKLVPADEVHSYWTSWLTFLRIKTTREYTGWHIFHALLSKL